jgi:hypothetical protein
MCAALRSRIELAASSRPASVWKQIGVPAHFVDGPARAAARAGGGDVLGVNGLLTQRPPTIRLVSQT